MTGCRGRLHVRHRANALEQRVLARLKLLRRRSRLRRIRQVDEREQQAVLTKAGIERQHVPQAADEQPRAENEHHRDGDLNHDEDPLQRESLVAARHPATGLQHLGGLCSCRPESRGEAAGETREGGRGAREREHRPVEAEIEVQPVVLGRQEEHEASAEHLGERDPEQRADRREQEALRQRLQNEPSRR